MEAIDKQFFSQTKLHPPFLGIDSGIDVAAIFLILHLVDRQCLQCTMVDIRCQVCRLDACV